MAKLIDVNGAVSIVNDRDQIVATFDTASGLPLVKQDVLLGKAAIPTADPHIKNAPYLSAGAVKYSNG